MSHNYSQLSPNVRVKILKDALDMLAASLANSQTPGPLVNVEVNGVALTIVLAAMEGVDLVAASERAAKYFEEES